jgi:hypothetical protein
MPSQYEPEQADAGKNHPAQEGQVIGGQVDIGTEVTRDCSYGHWDHLLKLSTPDSAGGALAVKLPSRFPAGGARFLQ